MAKYSVGRRDLRRGTRPRGRGRGRRARARPAASKGAAREELVEETDLLDAALKVVADEGKALLLPVRHLGGRRERVLELLHHRRRHVVLDDDRARPAARPAGRPARGVAPGLAAAVGERGVGPGGAGVGRLVAVVQGDLHAGEDEADLRVRVWGGGLRGQ